MPKIHLDNDVPVRLADLLRQDGHLVTTSRELGLERLADYQQLLTAYRQQAILLTRNRKDFILLHGAWQGFSAEWSISASHFGILILPHRHGGVEWTPEIAYARTASLIAGGMPRLNELFTWEQNGWMQRD